MSIKDKFTEEEWEIIEDAPFAIGLGMSDVEKSNPNAEIKEFDSLVSYLSKSRNRFESNELIDTVLKSFQFVSQSDGKGRNADQVAKYAEDVNKILKEKHPGEETQQYKEFLVEIAKKVAKAHGEEMLGLKRISKKEGALLEKLRKALEVE
ncbi:MAG: hypothetical protein ACLFQV_09455 [Vulcanimicrobiota bacterium]